ncbi:MAG: PAS domain S-box protein [Elusimicrobiota bacterium]
MKPGGDLSQYCVLFNAIGSAAAYCRIICDAQGRPVDFVHLEVNNAFRLLTGAADPVGKNITELFPGVQESCAELIEALGTVAKSGRSEYIEFDFKPLKKWLALSAYGTNNLCFLLVINDITPRYETATALRASERNFRNLFECSRDAMMILESPAWNITEVNRAALALFQVENMRALVDHFRKTGCRFTGTMLDSTAQEGSVHFESVYQKLNGKEFPADVILTQTESDGRMFVQATIRELTALGDAETARRLLSKAIEQSAESVLITDAKGVVRYVNPAFERVSGYASAEIIGKTPSLLNSGRHSKQFYADLWATLKRGEVWRGQFTNRRKDGTLYEEDASITPVFDGHGNITNFISVKRDLSAERALEQQVRQAQKMEVIGRLAGGVAHDFNNILTPIIGCAQFLAPVVSSSAQAAEDVETILSAAKRAATLTRQLLIFSRREKMDVRTLDLSASVLDIERLLRRTLGSGVTLSFSLAEQAAWVRGDVGHIDQVILNLAINSRDAMPRGGALTISTEIMELNAPRIAAHCLIPAGKYAVLRVADTGTGISPQVLEHLFEPFFTTKGRDKGTGLGLATVHGIVQAAGGHILVNSAPGEGTTFEIFFPLVSEPQLTVRQDDLSEDGSAATETILLCEDEQGVRKLIERTLKAEGYTVLDCNDGPQALAVESTHQGKIDLLLTDIILPGMPGTELARLLIAKRPGLKVLYTSGFTGDHLNTEGADAPGVDFLAKPFQLAELRARVRNSITGRPG